jgi:hypothetical protein
MKILSKAIAHIAKYKKCDIMSLLDIDIKCRNVENLIANLVNRLK